MNARNKLNVATFNGCVLFAGLIGCVLQSWPLFILALIVLVICSVHDGSIRPKARRH